MQVFVEHDAVRLAQRSALFSRYVYSHLVPMHRLDRSYDRRGVSRRAHMYFSQTLALVLPLTAPARTPLTLLIVENLYTCFVAHIYRLPLAVAANAKAVRSACGLANRPLRPFLPWVIRPLISSHFHVRAAISFIALTGQGKHDKMKPAGERLRPPYTVGVGSSMEAYGTPACRRILGPFQVIHGAGTDCDLCFSVSINVPCGDACLILLAKVLCENEFFPVAIPVPGEYTAVRQQNIGLAITVHVADSDAIAGVNPVIDQLWLKEWLFRP